MDDNTDFQMALKALQEEIEEIKEYKKMLAKVECQELRAIFLGAIKSGKQHAAQLLSWINQVAPQIMG